MPKVLLRSLVISAAIASTGIGAVVADAAQRQRRGVGTGSLIPGRSSGMVQSGFSEVAAIDLGNMPPAERMRFYRDAAACSVKADRSRVTRYLDSVFARAYDARTWRNLRSLYEDCLAQSRGLDLFSVPGDGRYLWLASVNAEAALRDGAVPPLLRLPVETLYQDAAFQELAASEMKTIRCLVLTEPARALAVIRSDTGSAGENAAISALAEFVGRCTDKGATVTLKRSMLRLYLAPTYYRLASHAGTLQAADKN